MGANRTEVTFGSNDVAAAVRSESGIPAGSGAYYFEVERLQPNGEYGLGFGPGSAPLNSTFASTSGVLSFMVCCSYQNGTESVRYVEGFPTHYGVVVDYTGEFPILHFLHLQETTSTAPGVSFSYPMEDHEGPLYLYAFGSGYAGSAVMRINFGNDLTSNPFSYDPVTTMDARYYRAGEGLTLHWYDATRIAPTVTPTRDHVAGVLGTAVTLSATATDPQDGNVVSQLVWRDGGGVVVGRGASVSFSSTSTGAKVVTASVADSSGLVGGASVEVIFVSTPSDDADGDRVGHAAELANGTDPANPDSDGDGLDDGDEQAVYGTSGALADSDGDGMPDGWEVRFGLNPLLADATSDFDNDGYSNLTEYSEARDPTDPLSRPGRVALDPATAATGVTIGADGLSVSYSSAQPAGVLSDQAIAPGSGWYYFEGRRQTVPGSHGFGVATSSASRSGSTVGRDAGSFSVTTSGTVYSGGTAVGMVRDPTYTEHYGIAIDYTGSTPIAYVITDCVPDSSGQNDGDYCTPVSSAMMPVVNSTEPVDILGPYTLSGVSGPLYALVYGSGITSAVEQSVLFGSHPDTDPFHFAAGYLLFNEGFVGAEYLGSGWGPENAYSGRETVYDDGSPVRMVKDEDTNWGITLDASGTRASYAEYAKMGVRANHPMIGEFRYFEGRRLIAPHNSGIGLITAHGQINPVPFMPSPPCMSINTTGSIWRDLVWVAGLPPSTTHYGFAVDYRAARPIVYVIANDALAYTMTLTDIFQPLYPMLYGDTSERGELVNGINFGAETFAYDPVAILTAANVDASALVLGWGAANAPQPTPRANRAPSLVLSAPAGTHYTSVPLTLTATATDPDEGSLAGAVQWTVDGIAQPVGRQLQLLPTQPATLDIRASVVDAEGLTATAQIQITVDYAPPADTDGDGLTDIEEAQLGTSPTLADTDGDGLDDFAEVRTYGTNPLVSDTDGDGLSDGDEVSLHGSDPLLVDTDGDQMPDGYEVGFGLDPARDDASGDLDGDGYTNLEEWLAGTAPNEASDTPPAMVGIQLSIYDRDPSVGIDEDGLVATFSDPTGFRGIRSNVGVAPGSGVHYFEATRLRGPARYGLGVATSSTSLRAQGGDGEDSFGVRTDGTMWQGGAALETFGGLQSTYGVVVDYRSSEPRIYFLTTETPTGEPHVVKTLVLPVSVPLYIHVWGTATSTRTLPYIRINGGDREDTPYALPAGAALEETGQDFGGAPIYGWGNKLAYPTPVMPSSIPDARIDTYYSTELTVTNATNLHLESGSWPAGITGRVTSGGYALEGTPTEAGDFPVVLVARGVSGKNESVSLNLHVATASEPVDAGMPMDGGVTTDGGGSTDAGTGSPDAGVITGEPSAPTDEGSGGCSHTSTREPNVAWSALLLAVGLLWLRSGAVRDRRRHR